MNRFVDCVCITATSSGTGAFVLGAAVSGFYGKERLVDGATYSYVVQQGDNVEVGSGTYVASSGTLSRIPSSSTNGGAAVDFDVNAAVAFTFTAADIAAVIAQAESGAAAATAKAAFNAYGLQWGVWFNATPVAGEVIALYSAPVSFEYPANFAGASTAAPEVAPAAEMVLSVEQQAGGVGGWQEVGTVTIAAVSGVVELATTGGAAILVNAGDRLRVVAPIIADTAAETFAITFKGLIP